jgi:hypothetical protein
MYRPIRHVAIAASWRAARETFDELLAEHHAANFRHQCELEVLREEVRELREIMSDVTTAMRTQADANVAELRHQLEIALIKLAPPDGKPLN